jgi:hypothetical protein
MTIALNSPILRRAGVALLAVCMALVAACGGTKVYTADKTVIYRDSIYNVSNVQRITARETAKTPGGEEINLATMDKKGLQAFFKENPGSMVSMFFQMDEQEVVYVRTKVDSYNEYSKLKNRYDRALKDLTKFLGDGKKTQLQLK